MSHRHLILLAAAATACANGGAANTTRGLFAPPPPTEARPVTDTFHGVEVTEGYRWPRVHSSCPSSSSRSLQISFSRSQSFWRMTFGGSYSASSYSISL